MADIRYLDPRVGVRAACVVCAVCVLRVGVFWLVLRVCVLACVLWVFLWVSCRESHCSSLVCEPVRGAGPVARADGACEAREWRRAREVRVRLARVGTPLSIGPVSPPPPKGSPPA